MERGRSCIVAWGRGDPPADIRISLVEDAGDGGLMGHEATPRPCEVLDGRRISLGDGDVREQVVDLGEMTHSVGV